MAYKIDFTARNYDVRSWRKLFLRAMLFSVIAGVGYGAYDIYKVSKQPTLNAKLAQYEVAAKEIESISTEWDALEGEHNAMLIYYRLVWDHSPTNLLNAMARPMCAWKSFNALRHIHGREYGLTDLTGKVVFVADVDSSVITNASFKQIFDFYRKRIDASCVMLCVIHGPTDRENENRRVIEEATRNVKDIVGIYESAESCFKAQGDAKSIMFGVVNHLGDNLYQGDDVENALAKVAEATTHLPPRLSPVKWTLNTGGGCKFDYRYEFSQGDKARQAKRLESSIVNSITSVVNVADGKVEVDGIKYNELLKVDNLEISARFSLPSCVQRFPNKNDELNRIAQAIDIMRKKVHEAMLPLIDHTGKSYTVQNMMDDYIGIGKSIGGKPDYDKVIDVLGWFNSADRFVAGVVTNKASEMWSEDLDRRIQVRRDWNIIGEGQWPWERFRTLDNEELDNGCASLVNNIKYGEEGVLGLKRFLYERRETIMRKLEPFVNSYDYDDIGNKPIIESDLINRVVKLVGINKTSVSFEHESDAVPVKFVKDNETFTITWVRWSLSLGETAERVVGEDALHDVPDDENTITLDMLADCATRVVELGPGYALESVSVNFRPDGNVAGAVLEGLLPTKRVEEKKEIAENAN